MASLGKFQFDKATVISVVVIIALLGIGYGFGTLAGEQNIRSEIIEKGAAQQSLAGVVKSANKDGFVLKIEDVGSGGGIGMGLIAPGGGGGGEKAEGEWKVLYGKGGATTGGFSGPGGSGSQEVKKGDKVQVSGLQVGDKTVVAQSVTKVTPPTPQPSSSPRAGALLTPKP